MLKVSLFFVLALSVQLTLGNEFFIDNHKIPDQFFKDLKPCKNPEERLAKLNEYIANYADNKTQAIEHMPFIYRKIYGSQTPKFYHDEVARDKTVHWDPEHLKEIDNMPFLKRVWARTKHPESCGKCNGLDAYKRKIDEKMVEKIHNLTHVAELARHDNEHEKCHSHGNCGSHSVEAAVVYADVSTAEEKKREEEILKEKQRKEAIEKLNYHFYRRAILESKLTGEAPEQIFKQYHRMSPPELQQRFHAVYQKYVEMRKKMQEYYQRNKGRENEIHKEYVKSLEKKEGLEKHLDDYQKFLREVSERKQKEEEARKMIAQKNAEEETKRREQLRQEEKHKAIYQKYLAEHRKAKEQKNHEEEYKRKEIEALDKQLAEIELLKANIKKEIERTKSEGDEKDLASLEKLENELKLWETKVKTDKDLKLNNLNIIANKINELRDKLLLELKSDLINKVHRNEESFENAKRRYLHVKENFNTQLNKVRDNLIKSKESEEYDSDVYKDDEDEENDEDDYNTHERQLVEIDEIKHHLTEELEKAKKEGKNIKDIYQLEGARKQIEDWEEKVKHDNAAHYEKAGIVNKKINEFKGFLDSYKVYKYSTPAPKEEE